MTDERARLTLKEKEGKEMANSQGKEIVMPPPDEDGPTVQLAGILWRRAADGHGTSLVAQLPLAHLSLQPGQDGSWLVRINGVDVVWRPSYKPPASALAAAEAARLIVRARMLKLLDVMMDDRHIADKVCDISHRKMFALDREQAAVPA